jgi:hypothetical protein
MLKDVAVVDGGFENERRENGGGGNTLVLG